MNQARWLLCREASPGKLGAFEDDLFRNAEMADVPIAAAIILGYPEGARTIGLAFCDAAGRALGACEYADDEYFCSTESVLVQLGAKEVVLPKVGLAVHSSTAVPCKLAQQYQTLRMLKTRILAL